jgi:hypothetical protein
MSMEPTPSVPTAAAPGGNVYVGPTLVSSLAKFVAALAAAQR